MRHLTLKQIIIFAAIVLAYTLAVPIALRFFSENGIVAILWPSSGIALAALLLFGYKYWPAIYLGAVISNVFSGTSLLVSGLIGVGNTAEALVGFWLINRGQNFNRRLENSRDYFKLIFWGGMLGSLASSIPGSLTLFVTGVTPQLIWQNMLAWWMGDFLGILIFAPLILIWSHLPRHWYSAGKIPELLIGFALTFLAGQVVFLGWFSAYIGEFARSFLIYAFILWGAFRFGKHATVLILLLIIVQALTGFILNVGYFARTSGQYPLIIIWLYISMLAFVGMALSSILSESRRAMRTLVRSDERYKLATSAGQIATWRIDLPREVFESDVSIKALTGYGPDELFSGAHFLQGIHAEDKIWFLNSWEKLRNIPHETLDLEVRYIHKDGYILWVNIKAGNQQNARGRIISIAGTLRDVTDRRVSRNALWNIEEKYRILYENYPLPAYTWQSEGNDLVLIEYNKAAYAFSNGNIESIIGKKASELYADNPRILNRLRKTLADRTTSIEEMTYRMLVSGITKELRVAYTYVPDGYVIVHTDDITERKTIHEALVKREKELNNLLENSPDIIARLDRKFKHLYVNDAIEKATGISAQFFLGKDHREIGMGLEQVYNWQSVLQETFLSGKERIYEFDFLTPQGLRHFHCKLVPEFNDAGKVETMLTMARDITELKQAEKDLRENESKFRAIFENSIDAIGVSYQGKHVFVNPAYLTLFGYDSSEELQGTSILDLIGLSEREKIQNKVQNRITGNTAPEIYETIGKRKDGKEFVMDAHVSMFALDNKIYTLAFLRDITAQKEAQEKIRYLGNHDVLTGLPNRVLFSDRLSQAIQRAHAYGGKFALIYLDIDHFKKINDAHGHNLGDEYLKSISKLILSSVRDVDTVSRQGGDEFLILLPEVQSDHEAAHFANTVLKKLSSPVTVEDRTFSTTVSAGIAIYPKDGDDAKTLIKHADIAMYHAKANGRNQFQYFSAELNAMVHEKLAIENDLRLAIQEQQLFLVYQPVIDQKTNKLRSVEALLRWHHPEKNFIAPDKFIPIAEDSGQIAKIGEWVLDQACAQMSELSKRLKYHVKFSVNVSSIQLRDQGFAATVKKIVSEHDIQAGQLNLEFTESVLIQSNQNLLAMLNDLSASGVSLSVDDFGTGYSSLNYLRQFKIKYLKIDKSFVRDIMTDPDDAAIVSTIINLAHNLRLQVIAEGVETEEQLRFLESNSCDAIQGYYFSKPVPLSQLEAYITQNS